MIQSLRCLSHSFNTIYQYLNNLSYFVFFRKNNKLLKVKILVFIVIYLKMLSSNLEFSFIRLKIKLGVRIIYIRLYAIMKSVIKNTFEKCFFRILGCFKYYQ